MRFSDLIQWQYLIFVLPFLGALFYLMLSATGLIAAEGVDLDHDFDHDVDLDHDFDHDVDHDHDIGIEHDPTFALRVLSILGVGKVPLSLLIMTFCFIWGFVGIVCNNSFKNILIFPIAYTWISVIVTLIITITLTRLLASSIAKIMPSTESVSVKPKDYIGKGAKTRYTVTEKNGAATTVLDMQHLQFSCRIKPGQEPIPANTEVIIMSYDSEARVYYVDVNPLINKTRKE
ncbi:MAG: hypothetical protein ABH884_00410 [Candidatus Komeilibacteria bacterium]